MFRTVLVSAVMALPAFAAEPVGVAEFEAYATGKTLTHAVGGKVYGTEQYLPGRRVIWAYKDQECTEGYWYEQNASICFVYDDHPAPQCWTYHRDKTALFATFVDDPVGAEPSLVQESPGPVTCSGPDLGV